MLSQGRGATDRTTIPGGALLNHPVWGLVAFGPYQKGKRYYSIWRTFLECAGMFQKTRALLSLCPALGYSCAESCPGDQLLMTESLYISLAKREKVKIRDSGSIIKGNWPNEAFIQKNASVSAPPPQPQRGFCSTYLVISAKKGLAGPLNY